MKLIKRLIGLMAQGASKEQFYLEIGAHFLKKGAGFHIGQIIREKQTYTGCWRVKVITGLFYNFRENKITHTAENRIVKA